MYWVPFILGAGKDPKRTIGPQWPFNFTMGVVGQAWVFILEADEIAWFPGARVSSTLNDIQRVSTKMGCF
jgi:hypothetical protein